MERMKSVGRADTYKCLSWKEGFKWGADNSTFERIAFQMSGSNLGAGTIRRNHIKLPAFTRLVLGCCSFCPSDHLFSMSVPFLRERGGQGCPPSDLGACRLQAAMGISRATTLRSLTAVACHLNFSSNCL